MNKTQKQHHLKYNGIPVKLNIDENDLSEDDTFPKAATF